MKFVIQRVSSASVEVEGEVKGKIDRGFLVLIGVGKEDTPEIADKYVKKLLGLRIFEDEAGKTNLSLKEIGREFDNRDHTTVLHSTDRIEKLKKSNPDIAEVIKDIRANINARYE